MSNVLPTGLTDCLLWSEELGRGFHTREPMEYEGKYFAKYQELDMTPMGHCLTNVRVNFVRSHTDSQIVDIGIGGGMFVEEIDGQGFDVNDDAVVWLLEQVRFCDPYKLAVDAITCWDSLEHIPEPEKLIAHVKDWVFVSMPIYKDMKHCLASKHFKPGEHIHYFTHEGLLLWFEQQGFICIEYNDIESKLGREGIVSYAFRRYDNGVLKS